jgi:peptidoglycan/xylan/chitin deacetylase (PgdA/CDA1 family)
MSTKLLFRALGYSTALTLAVSVLGVSNVTAGARPESSPAVSDSASAVALSRSAAAPSSTAVPAAILLPAGPSRVWSAEDFALSPTERQLIERLASYQPSAPVAELRPDCAVLSCVALTFDDGPSRYTEALLAVLAAHDVPATFFVVGKSARALPDELVAIHLAGHEIALHSDQHRRMPTLSNSAIAKDFERSRQTLRDLVGVESELYRPPYGMHSARVGKLANAAVIMWDVDPQDWRVRSSRPITQRVLSRVGPGSIVVLHELEQTVVALDSLVAELLARGYTLVTVSEILGEAPIHSKIYRSGLAAPELRAAG